FQSYLALLHYTCVLSLSFSSMYFLSSILHSFLFFFLLLRPPPRSTLFPYTTLFRSHLTSRLGGRVREVPLLGQLELELTQERYRSEEHTSELQSLRHLVCRLLLEKKKKKKKKVRKYRKQAIY